MSNSRASSVALAGVHVRVGTDVESIADVTEALEQHGNRYARRIFTEDEIAACGGATSAAAPRLAARFAAKEAVLKLLAPIDVVPPWKSIEIRSVPGGAPQVFLHEEAADLAGSLGISRVEISLSHGAGIGTATAVALATVDRR